MLGNVSQYLMWSLWSTSEYELRERYKRDNGPDAGGNIVEKLKVANKEFKGEEISNGAQSRYDYYSGAGSTRGFNFAFGQ